MNARLFLTTLMVICMTMVLPTHGMATESTTATGVPAKGCLEQANQPIPDQISRYANSTS